MAARERTLEEVVWYILGGEYRFIGRGDGTPGAGDQDVREFGSNTTQISEGTRSFCQLDAGINYYIRGAQGGYGQLLGLGHTNTQVHRRRLDHVMFVTMGNEEEINIEEEVRLQEEARFEVEIQAPTHSERRLSIEEHTFSRLRSGPNRQSNYSHPFSYSAARSVNLPGGFIGVNPSSILDAEILTQHDPGRGNVRASMPSSSQGAR